MTVMSGNATSLNTVIAKGFNEIFTDDVDAQAKIDSSDPRLIQFNRFLDSVIKIGQQDHNLSKSESLAEVSKFLKSNDNLDNTLLLVALTQGLKDKKDEHINFVTHALSDKLRSNAEELGKLTDVMDVNIKPGIAADKDYASATSANVQEDFSFHMQLIGEEILELDQEDRADAIGIKIGELTQGLVARYGSEKVQDFSNSIKDSQLASYTYLQEDETGAKLPAFELGFEIQEMLENADFSKMETTEKETVIELVESFFASVNEDGEISEKDKLSFELNFSKLSPQEQAFYEHTRSQADEISKIASDPMELISSLGKNLPNILVPGILGAIVSYLMGFGFIGGAAAIAMGALGDKVEAGEEKAPLASLAKPPAYKKSIAQPQAAA